ncbi:hypothetical protein Tco_0697249 [Tanacetum coccineum]
MAYHGCVQQRKTAVKFVVADTVKMTAVSRTFESEVAITAAYDSDGSFRKWPITAAYNKDTVKMTAVSRTFESEVAITAAYDSGSLAKQ